MRGEQRPILLIEDSDEDYDVTASALKLAGVSHPIQRFASSREALNFINKKGEYRDMHTPTLVLLDLNLPGIDGRQVLREMGQMHWLGAVPVVVLTTSTDPRDVDLCYRKGARGFLVKPVDLERFEAMIRTVADYWLRTVQAAPEGGEMIRCE